jgi:hypothetical protein
MRELIPLVAVLACPVVMGATMWWMHRRTRRRADD